MPNSLIYLFNRIYSFMRILNMQRRHASKAFYCLKKLLSIHAHAYAKSVAKGFFYKRAAQSTAHLQKGALKAIRVNRNLRAAQSAVHLQKGVVKAIHMNRNLRAAQSAAHLQKGVVKAIHMNRNLRAAQSAAHLQEGVVKAIHMNRN
jgi:uncharacterized protein YwbE